jgi:hypothetical protein
VLRAVAGGGLYLVALGLLSMGLAVIVRHTAGAISTFVGILFVLPLINAALPSAIGDAVGRWLPADIGATMTSVSGTPHTLGPTFNPWVGLALLTGYAVAALVVGAFLLVRRDA